MPVNKTKIRGGKRELLKGTAVDATTGHSAKKVRAVPLSSRKDVPMVKTDVVVGLGIAGLDLKGVKTIVVT